MASFTPPASAPVAPTRPYVHQSHGVSRQDPYQWLRDKTSAESVAYLTAERDYYNARTAHLGKLRDSLAREMAARVAPQEESVRWREGGYWYFTRLLPGQDYPQLHRTPLGRPADDGEVVLDEAALAAGHAFQELGLRLVSPDGRTLAYSVDHDGDEVYELRFRDLGSGEDLPDRVAHTYYTGAWSADSSSFFYTVNDDTYRPFQVWRHTVGTPAAGDQLVMDEADDQFELGVERSRSGQWVVITSQSRNTSEVWVVPADAPATEPAVVAPRRRGVEYSVAHAPGRDGDFWLVVTNDGAQEFRLVSVLILPGESSPAPDTWREVLPENPRERLHAVDVFGGHVVLSLVTDGQQVLRVHTLASLLADVVVDPVDIVSGVPGGLLFLGPNEEPETDSVLVRVESAVEPPAWYAVDLSTGSRVLARQTTVPNYDPDRYRIERRTVPVRDGEQVLVTLVRHRDTPLDGTAPLLLYGYGAYESAWWPGFEPSLASLLDRGVVYAHAHIRGGGEGGRRWWLQGSLAAKHHTFEDFVDVADWLADQSIVDGSRIVSRGLSAGGLLQGAVYSMRPDRFRAVVAEVPFVDVVTSMFDADLPLTAGEWDEWGDPRDAEQFAWLLAYSPYDNVPGGRRPDLLVTGALHDPRVSVHEPAKWVARLRATDDGSGGEVLFRAETGQGGHTGPIGRYAALGYEAEVTAYILDELGFSGAPGEA